MEWLTNTSILLADQDMPLPMASFIVFGVIGLVVLVAIFISLKNFFSWTKYDLDGSYGGGKGLRRIFRYKRLKRIDREGVMRGGARAFKDPELEKLLSEGRLSDAAGYLTGILNAAKDAGDRHTLRRYARYSEEIIGMYDELELEQKGGKALHMKK
jgi:hypothetical protein